MRATLKQVRCGTPGGACGPYPARLRPLGARALELCSGHALFIHRNLRNWVPDMASSFVGILNLGPGPGFAIRPLPPHPYDTGYRAPKNAARGRPGEPARPGAGPARRGIGRAHV